MAVSVVTLILALRHSLLPLRHSRLPNSWLLVASDLVRNLAAVGKALAVQAQAGVEPGAEVLESAHAASSTISASPK